MFKMHEGFDALQKVRHEGGARFQLNACKPPFQAGERNEMAEVSAKESAQCFVYVIDRSFRLVYCSESTRKSFPQARLGGMCYSQLRGEQSICGDCPWAFIDFQDESSTRKVVYNANVSEWLEISCIGVDWPDAGFCVVVAAKNISEANKDSFAQLTHQSVYDALIEIDLVDEKFKFLYFEEEKYELPAGEQTLDSITDVAENFVHPDDRASFIQFWSTANLRDRFARGDREVRGDFRQKLKSGEYHWTSQTLTPVRHGSGDDEMLMCFMLDIEEQKRLANEELRQEKLRAEELLEHDALTGLFRSEAFFDHATELVLKNPDVSFEIACIDMRNFRLFNEWYGRDQGDRLLETVSSRLKQVAEKAPSVAGYFGADNFAIILPQDTGFEEGLVSPVKVASVAFGDDIGFLPVAGLCKVDEGVPLRLVYDRATVAKSLCKNSYANHLAWYEEDAAQQLEDDAKLFMEIQRALKNREFTLFWQPQCDIRTGRIVGAEALVRWQHPEQGVISPGYFIPLLEKTGFIVNLDLYVWEEVCRQLRAWLDAGIEPVPVSVNISQADLSSLNVPDLISEFASDYGIDRTYLKLEITESAFAQDGTVAETTERLKNDGFAVLMDDFGSGASSLGILKNLDVDVLKIDMTFLDWTNEKAGRGESILESIIHMTDLMELRTIVEGVETCEQVDFLASIGCGYAQGYYFYRPMPTDEFEEKLLDSQLIDRRGVQRDPKIPVNLEELVTERAAGRSAIDAILGPIAVYERRGSSIKLEETSRQYTSILGDLGARGQDALSLVHEDDRHVATMLFEEAERHPVSGAQGYVRHYRSDGVPVLLKMRLFYLGLRDDAGLFLGSLLKVEGESALAG